jgi:hypothetical protein
VLFPLEYKIPVREEYIPNVTNRLPVNQQTSPAYAGQGIVGSTAFGLKHGQGEIVKEFV